MADVPMDIDLENAAAVAPQLGPHYMVRNQNAKLTHAQMVLRYADKQKKCEALKKANLRLRENIKILTAQLKGERKEKRKRNPDSWATVRAKHAVLASTADNLKGAKKRNFEDLAGTMYEIAVESVKRNKKSHSEETVEVQFRETRLVLYKALHEMDREANIAAAVQYETILV
jgi:hypothetical protein